jgi:hypothetical protein
MKLFVRETVYEVPDYSASFILRILAYTFSSDNQQKPSGDGFDRNKSGRISPV